MAQVCPVVGDEGEIFYRIDLTEAEVSDLRDRFPKVCQSLNTRFASREAAESSLKVVESLLRIPACRRMPDGSYKVSVPYGVRELFPFDSQEWFEKLTFPSEADAFAAVHRIGREIAYRREQAALS